MSLRFAATSVEFADEARRLDTPGGIRLCIVMGSHWAVQMGGSQYQAKCLLEVLGKHPEIETYYLARLIPEKLLQPGYRIVPIAGAWTPRTARLLPDLPPLYKALKRIRPTVIYQRGMKAYTGVCAWYCARFGARFVFHAASDRDVRRQRYRGWTPSTLIRRLERRIAEYGLQRASAIVVQTADQARALLCDYGLEAAAIVPNFHPLPTGEPIVRNSDRLRVVWVANFKPVKNPEAFVEIATALAKRPDIEFAMIGRPGDTRRYAELHRHIARLSNLSYLGELPLERVDLELARSDILVNTSWSEGFPNTFIQAWLRSVPVVSCLVDPDGCLARGGAGVLAGSVAGVISVLIELAENRARLQALGESARRYAFENHRPERALRLVDLLMNGDRHQSGGGCGTNVGTQVEC